MEVKMIVSLCVGDVYVYKVQVFFTFVFHKELRRQ